MLTSRTLRAEEGMRQIVEFDAHLLDKSEALLPEEDRTAYHTYPSCCLSGLGVA